MSVLESIQTALSGVSFPVGAGRYPDGQETCGKIIFTGEGKPVRYMGGGQTDTETFTVVVKGGNYLSLEQNACRISAALKSAGFIQTGGYENEEPKEGETDLQIAVRFKSVQTT